MPISAKAMRAQLNILKPLMGGVSLKTIRKGQNKIGELMESRYRNQVVLKTHEFEHFAGAWVIPTDERRQGVILYLHGGGYTCGDVEYAVGFGSMLSVQSGTRVFCPAYRLAPEHPFPAAIDDAVESYRYLLSKGYAASHITLCGESAGGGLCYALCLKLQELGLPMPCGIIAISPWTDMTASGVSYTANREIDPSMSIEMLEFFADNYTTDRRHPLVSPLFADLTGMPPSLLFAGGDEIMLDDAVQLHNKLLAAGCQSRLQIAPERWHGYLLYGLDEDLRDFSVIDRFLNEVMAGERKLQWMRLDNAAKIYPAARRPHWSNVFRLSATLTDEVDVAVLRTALDVTVRRFPSIAVRLRRGVFWYYLQQLAEVPEIREENSYPLAQMSRDETRRCAIRVIVYKRRIAIEVFHSLTDGNGALVFLKSLVAEYLQQKHGVYIPAEHGVLGRLEEPSPEETEDSFQKHAGTICASRQENTAWRLSGTPEPGSFLHLTCLEVPVAKALAKAHEYGVSLTNFLCAVLMQALQNLQKEQVPEQRHRKPIKVLIPVNLRKLFGSKTLRNFAMYTTPEILPRLGEYSFEEICQVIKVRMGMDITPKQMSMKIATNISSERLMAVRVMPLFIKNIVMKAIFDSVGERKSCLTLSNLGAVQLPEAMRPYVERLDFILGVQATAPYNCGVLSYGDTLYINFIRNIQESALEYHFYRVLQQLGIPATVQSNAPEKEDE
ncbi:MAG: alpha/beta hydrolase fold domain-containing protein [Clostridia bacterium]|nr:alpha/beta hydrolase fold domain-containing protein [Clostridia bacterium]